jgi:hypothetical protein
MLAFPVAALILTALFQIPQPLPQPQPAVTTPAPIVSSPPTAAPTASPQPSAASSPSPSASPADTIPPEPVRTATPAPRATPNLFAYVVDPPAVDAASPRIVEIAINDRTVHAGQMLLVKITTSSNVTSLFARTMGHQMAIPLMAPGLFAGQQQLPTGIPYFLLNRTYQIDFIASTADGKSTVFTLPLRLEH